MLTGSKFLFFLHPHQSSSSAAPDPETYGVPATVELLIQIQGGAGNVRAPPSKQKQSLQTSIPSPLVVIVQLIVSSSSRRLDYAAKRATVLRAASTLHHQLQLQLGPQRNPTKRAPRLPNQARKAATPVFCASSSQIRTLLPAASASPAAPWRPISRSHPASLQ